MSNMILIADHSSGLLSLHSLVVSVEIKGISLWSERQGINVKVIQK